jgi:hypothetical protein
VCCGFLEHVRQRPPSTEETLLMQQALEASLLDRMEGVAASVIAPAELIGARPTEIERLAEIERPTEIERPA